MQIDQIKNIAVLGAGTMGPGIAHQYAVGEYYVRLYDINEDALENAKVVLCANLDAYVEEGLLPAEEAEQIFNRVLFTTDLAQALENVQFVQETVVEKPDIKRHVFQDVADLINSDTIVASNTSALDPFALIPESIKERFCTAHWFTPPHIIPLVEVAKGPDTSEQTMATVIALVKKCGKIPVRVERFIPGHIVNRLQLLLNTEVFYLLEQGICTPEQLDIAVKSSLMLRGMVLGVVQRYDFTGLDLSARNMSNGSYKIPEIGTHPSASFDHVDRGEFGVKRGKGFYDYKGRDLAEILKKRDRRLFQILKASKDMLQDRV